LPKGSEGIADAALETIEGYERRKQAKAKPRIEQLPAHLPRYEVKLDVPADQETCETHGERQVIGYDWQETLEVVPPKLIVRRTGTPQLACPKAPESGVVEAPRPVGLVSSAHRNDLDIFVSVKDVLDRLLAGETHYDDLRPDVWKQSHPEAIRIYRVKERQAKADDNAVKRARRRIAKRG
jgi:hypothetical protein